MPVLDPNALIDNRVAALRDMHARAGQVRAEVDVSGGVDSAVLVGLLAKAVGAWNLTAIHLAINSDPAALARAREVCDTFGVKLIVFDGTAIFQATVDGIVSAMEAAGYSKLEIAERIEKDPTILGSIRSTSRAPWGRAANRLSGGGIRHGTGNEDEDRVLRFYQKGGDGEVDSNPIAMLSKGEVFQLARALGVPRSILTARPSPDLWGIGETHNDEEEIGAQLGLKGCGFPFYSYVDPDTGAYKNVGLIERLHRFLDLEWDLPEGSHLYGTDLIQDTPWRLDGDRPLGFKGTGAEWLEAAVRLACDGPFKNIPANIVRTLFESARRVEAATRHKMNPNCPTLGDRGDLVFGDNPILTNELPV